MVNYGDSMRDDYSYLEETVEPDVFTEWQEVDVEICSFSDLGINVAIDDEYLGLVYYDHVFEEYDVGQELTAYIKLVRPDGKIDVSFQPKKGSHVPSTSDKIIEHLNAAGGKSHFNSKSSPEDIEDEFQVSKKVFKQAIGALYKKRRITISTNGMKIIKGKKQGAEGARVQGAKGKNKGKAKAQGTRHKDNFQFLNP